MKRLWACAFAGALAAIAGGAEAQPLKRDVARIRTEATSPPRMPAPFILPDLAHSRLDVGVDAIVGRLSAIPGVARTSAPATLVRPAVEANVFVPRRVYLGLAYPFGTALPLDGGLVEGEAARPAGMRRFSGNVEAHVRTVFPLPTWLEIGFVLGVVVPTAVFDRGYRPNRSAVESVSSLDPTGYAGFLPGRFALRPAGDLRIRRGPVVFQGRHGLDILLDNQGIEKAALVGRLLGHLGYLARRDVEVSLEASQVYFLASDDKVTTGTGPEIAFADRYRVRDGNRSSITIGPAVRAMTRHFDYGFAFVTNLGDPRSPVADGFIGLRFSIIGHVPP
ncbi:MAG: hypothetical protein KIT84_29155 [Labilithrix sp.]|nr:hypothetical protein [Labilithrix sp.]MCW5815130.1 hypothetical protein [Labilithrix sp.]